MKRVEFSNGITMGAMVVDKGWYSSHTQITDKYELYQIAQKDKKSRMVLLYILDVGLHTTNVCLKN